MIPQYPLNSFFNACEIDSTPTRYHPEPGTVRVTSGLIGVLHLGLGDS